MSASNHQINSDPTAVLVHCPHCNGLINVSSVVPTATASTTQNNPDPVSPFVRFGRASGGMLIRHFFPVGSVFGQSDAADKVERRLNWSAALRAHWKVFAAFVASVVLVCLVLMYWGKPPLTAREQNASSGSNVQPSSTAVPLASESTKTAILDILTQYNRAETEAAALLTMTPLQPLLVPDGPLIQRRAAQIAERQQRKAPHRTMLLRWAVGVVAVTGNTAMVTTQETWSNQEANAVAPEQATVRVTYTLSWNEESQRWLIADSNQSPL